MIVASNQKAPEQGRLFEVGMPLAACRNWVGDFYEEATKNLFGAKRLAINSICTVCPDLRCKDGSYLECKSIGGGNAAMAYNSRLAKDRAFVAEGHRLNYILWKHSFKCKEGVTLGELREGLARSTVSCLLLPLDLFASIMEAGNLMTLNKANGIGQVRRGYGSLGYTEGYRTPLSVFRPLCTFERVVSVEAYGQKISEIKLMSVADVSEMLRKK